MDADDRTERIMRDVERALEAMNEEGVAGGTIGPDGLRLGMPDWEERTRHQRLSERAKTHGYPFGFAKTRLAARRELMQTMHDRLQALDEEGRAAAARAHEAMAWALDAERFLGSFNDAGSGGLRMENVDRVADQILAWLDHIGFRVVPTEATDNGALPEDGRLQDPVAPRSGREETEETVMTNPEGAPAEAPAGEPEAEVECSACEGTGYVGNGMFEETCPLCGGSGALAPDQADRYDPYDPLLGGEPSETSVKSLMSNTGLGASELGLSLAGLDLRESVWSGYGFNLSRTNFSGSDLSGADFTEVNLSGADLSGAKLVGASLADADLTGASLHGADLANADLTGARLTDVDLESAGSLDGTVLISVEGLSTAQLERCLKRGAKGSQERQGS